MILTRQKIKKDWGSRCKELVATCPTCQAWIAYLTLEDLYEMNKAIKKYEKKYKFPK